MSKLKKFNIVESFADDVFDGSILNIPSAQRVINDRILSDSLSAEIFKYKIGIIMSSFSNKIDEFDVLMEAFKAFRENVRQILESERKISDFAIYDEPFAADPSDKTFLQQATGQNKVWMFYFAINAQFDRYSDVERFFYRLCVAILRYSGLFKDKFEMGQLSTNIVNPKYEFFVSELDEWYPVGGNALYPKDMLRKKNEHNTHRYDGKFLALMILFSAVFLYDERCLPDYLISPLQKGYGNVNESLWALSRHFIKDLRLRNRIIFDENKELVGKMIDTEYLSKHLDDVYVIFWGPREYTAGAKRTPLNVKFETEPIRICRYEISDYSTTSQSQMLIDYMKRHLMRVNGCVYCRKTQRSYTKGDIPEFSVMVYIHVSFIFYAKDLSACDMILAIPSKNNIESVERLNNRIINLLENICQTDISNTEFYRLILEDAYGAGLLDENRKIESVRDILDMFK